MEAAYHRWGDDEQEDLAQCVDGKEEVWDDEPFEPRNEERPEIFVRIESEAAEYEEQRHMEKIYDPDAAGKIREPWIVSGTAEMAVEHQKHRNTLGCVDPQDTTGVFGCRPLHLLQVHRLRIYQCFNSFLQAYGPVIFLRSD